MRKCANFQTKKKKNEKSNVLSVERNFQPEESLGLTLELSTTVKNYQKKCNINHRRIGYSSRFVTNIKFQKNTDLYIPLVYELL